ncbi:MAG: RNA polymerase sigma factor [Peptococcaceae bacterium]|nr:RNA polymerase sigma factor [Peptococcaceae bacterium]
MDADLFLLRRIKQGDEAALETLVRKYYDDILRYCTFHTARREDAEDLTQETFTRFFAKLSEYRHQGKTKNYLYTIAANLCRNHYKRKQAVPIEDAQLTYFAGTTSDEETSTTHLLLEWALDALPVEQREVIILHYYQGLKQREIAEVLEISLPLVKYRLRQAKAALQDILEKEGFTDDAGRTSENGQ